MKVDYRHRNIIGWGAKINHRWFPRRELKELHTAIQQWADDNDIDCVLRNDWQMVFATEEDAVLCYLSFG